MPDDVFTEGPNAKGHLQYASPVIDQWWWGQTRQCNRLEVRELRAEFVVQEAYYGRKSSREPWMELQDYSRYPVCQPLSNRNQAIQRAKDDYKNARAELADLEHDQLAEAQELRRRELAYELQGPSWEQQVRMAEAEERRDARLVETMSRALHGAGEPDGRSVPVLEPELER